MNAMTKARTVVLTGGGTGGHITPVLAVASELKKLQPEIKVVYIGQKGGVLLDIPAQHPAIDEVYAVRAGKFRRYHGVGWRQVFDLETQWLNIRDAFWVLVGIWQSFWLIKRLKPGIIFTRGGYVSVPVALGGKLNGVPYITHDSDSTPSLANRLIAKWAVAHAVALPKELYPYPSAKTVMVGVPVSEQHVPVDTKLQHKYRDEIGLGAYKKILLATGGGNGADQLNKIIVESSPTLLSRYQDLAIVVMAGRSHENMLNRRYDELLSVDDRKRVVVKGFVTDLYRYSGAADVIVGRAGASSLAEFAIQHKACVIIPSKQLAWQGHHARTLAERDAIINLPEKDAAQPGRLMEEVSDLFDHEDKRARLANALGELARPDAAKALAMLLLDKMRAV